MIEWQETHWVARTPAATTPGHDPSLLGGAFNMSKVRAPTLTAAKILETRRDRDIGFRAFLNPRPIR